MSCHSVLGFMRRNISPVNGRATPGLIFAGIVFSAFVILQTVVILEETRAAENPTALFECNHDQLWREFNPEGSLSDVQACPQLFACSVPTQRHLWRVTSNPPPIHVRLMFHIIAEDDGSNPAVTPAFVDSQVVQLNADYLPYGIQFFHKVRIFNSTEYRVFPAPSFFSANQMKLDVYIDPHLQFNIIVTQLTNPGNSWAPNPDLGDPYGPRGGLMMSLVQFDLPRHIITHEIGHAFGMAHPQVGYRFFNCGHACAENLTTGASNFNGDQCADTPPQPPTFGPIFSGIDSCSGLPWPAVPATNHMNFSETSKTGFTLHQAARMRCYIDNQMSNWVAGVTFDTVGALFGADSLEATFSSESDITVNQWRWSFGDGDSAFVSNPTHKFGPGLHAVTAQVETDSGTFAYQRTDYVAVHADSVIPADVSAFGGESVRVDLYARNYISLTSMWVPFVWNGPLDISFDSGSVAGLRTESMTANLTSIDPFGKKGLFTLTATADTVLEPGNGPVLSLYFTLPVGADPNSSSVVIQDWASNILQFNSQFGSYTPAGLSGSVTLACCANAGDANNDASVNISDVTFLISRIFAGGSAPPCCSAADANGSGALNIADVTYLIARIFAGGPAPVCGPVGIGC